MSKRSDVIIRSFLGYRPEISLEEGLDRTVAWYRTWLSKRRTA